MNKILLGLIGAVGFAGVVGVGNVPAFRQAMAASQSAAKQSADLKLKDIKLADLVTKAMPADPKASSVGIMLVPSLVRFNATLLEGPKPQKAEKLLESLAMMGFSPAPKVSQRIVLGYFDAKGKSQHIVAYIEDKAVPLMKTKSVGDAFEFTAVHAYNFSRGPGLLVMAFGPPK